MEDAGSQEGICLRDKNSSLYVSVLLASSQNFGNDREMPCPISRQTYLHRDGCEHSLPWKPLQQNMMPKFHS